MSKVQEKCNKGATTTTQVGAKGAFSQKPRKRARNVWQSSSAQVTPNATVVSDNDDTSSLISSTSVIARRKPSQTLVPITTTLLCRKVSLSENSETLHSKAQEPKLGTDKPSSMTECNRPRKRRRFELNPGTTRCVFPPEISVTKQTKKSGITVIGTKVAILEGPFKGNQGEITHMQVDRVKVCFRPAQFLISRWVQREYVQEIKPSAVVGINTVTNSNAEVANSTVPRSLCEGVTIEIASGAEADVSTMGEWESIQSKTNDTSQPKENLLGMEIIHRSPQELTSSAATQELSTQISFGSITANSFEAIPESMKVKKSVEVHDNKIQDKQELVGLQGNIFDHLERTDALKSDSTPAETILNTQTSEGESDEELLNLVENLLDTQESLRTSTDPMHTVQKDSEMIEDLLESSEDLIDIELLNPFVGDNKLCSGTEITEADMMYMDSSGDRDVYKVTPELDKGFLNEFLAEVFIESSNETSHKANYFQETKRLDETFDAPALGEASVGSMNSVGESLLEDEHGVCSDNFLDDLVHIHIPNGLLDGR